MDRRNENAESLWREEYAGLTEYIRQNPELRITPQSMRIPKPLREGFYGHIDAVTKALAADLAGGRLEEAKSLAQRIEEVRRQLYAGSSLKRYRLPASIENLIADPEQAVSGPLFELVMDSLQHHLEAEEMEDRAEQLLRPFLKDLQRGAYEAWAYLNIIAAWKPVRFYGIVTSDFSRLTAAETDEAIMGHQVSSPDKRLPETVFETADGRTLAVKCEVGLELDYYGEKVSREKGYSSGGDTTDELSHRVLLVYCFPTPREVQLTADAERSFVRPTELTCSFLLPSEMENEYLFSSFVRHIRTVRSLRPVQVLSFDESGAFPEAFADDPRVPKWERVAVGYDTEQLKMIASKLTQNRQEET